MNINKSELEWKEVLSDEEYRILRNKGTELPHSGKFNLHFENGTYCCSACNEELFESNTKFNAQCGWPSFDESIKSKVDYILDKSHGMTRTEIICNSCGSHLGHVFNDGPTKSGTRYCVNSVSLKFKKS